MLRQDISQVTQDFYDGLYLHSLLQSDTRQRIKSGERGLPRIGTLSKRDEWQVFLDDTCLLCDSSPGGATTTAIAVEQRSRGTTFWVSSNTNNDKELEMYLMGLLGMIRVGSRHFGVGDHYTTQIFHEAVSRSPGRVENYAGRLRSALESLEIAQAAEHEGVAFPLEVKYGAETGAD